MAASAAEASAFKAECQAGDANQRPPQIPRRRDFRPRRLRYSKRPQADFRRIVHADHLKVPPLRRDAWKIDAPPGAQRVAHYHLGRYFIAGGSVQRHPIGGGVTGRFEQVPLNSAGERGGAIRAERISALSENPPQTIFFVRHAFARWRERG